jgi:hypothetical protein
MTEQTQDPTPDPAPDPLPDPVADRPHGDYGTSAYAVKVKALNNGDIAALTSAGYTTKFSEASA